jgi:hypothetical protein
MVVVDRAYAGAAAQATLQTAMTPTTPGAGGTITVDDDSGYPSSGKFEIVIDRGQNNEESLLINSRSGTTFTIGSRGYDGTVANTHSSGVSLVEHELSGVTVQKFVDHVDDVESDPHSTKLLNNARHDLEARHTFGAAYGTPVTPTALTPDIAGAAGTGNNPAREDHVHNVPAAAAGNISPDDAAAEGGAASFARSDHTHGITAAIANTITPDATPAEGAATSFSRSDHTHGAAAATASTLTGANAEGSSSSFARADHNHAFTATSADVVTFSQGTSSSSYTDLANVGPSVTMTPPPSGKVLVHIYGLCDGSGAGVASAMSFELSSGNTQAADDSFAISNVETDARRLGATFLLTGLAASSTLFRAKYRATGGGTATFADRRLIVQPILT